MDPPPPGLRRVLSLDSLFQDDQLDRFEARIMRARCLRTLRMLAREHGVMAAGGRGGRRNAEAAAAGAIHAGGEDGAPA